MSKQDDIDVLKPLLSKKQHKVIMDASKKLGVSYEDVFIFLMENQMKRIYEFGEIKNMTIEKLRKKVLDVSKETEN